MPLVAGGWSPKHHQPNGATPALQSRPKAAWTAINVKFLYDLPLFGDIANQAKIPVEWAFYDYNPQVWEASG